MPPEDNKINPPTPAGNNTPFEPLKVDIDPVFKGNPPASQGGPTQGVGGTAYEVLSNQQYTPSYQNNAPTNSSPNNIPKFKPAIRTYKDDVASAIQASHLSSINIAVAENERMHNKLKTTGSTDTGEESAGSYSKSKIIIAISILLIVIGLSAIAFVYLAKNNTTVVNKTQSIPSFITTEYKEELNLESVAKNRFVSALSSKLNDLQIPVNNVYAVYVTTGASTTKRLVTASEFASLAELEVPDILRRTLVSDFMVGMISFDRDLSFLILKTSSFENTFAGMLEWEKTMEKDFTQLFRLNSSTGESGIAAALTPTTEHKFEDGVIINQDVRLLRGTDGKIMLLYSILNKDTIVITVNENSFKEIVDRLNKEKGLKR